MSILNIQSEANAILTTVLLLNEKFSMKYVSEIVRGFTFFPKSETHKQLETYGSLPKTSEERVLNMMDYLIEDDFLKVKDNNGILTITEKGKRFLAQNHELWVESSLLQSSPTDAVLTEKLKRLRKEWAEKDLKRPYEIFSDYTLRKIVQLKAVDFLTLKNANLLTQTALFGYGMKLVEVVKEALENLPEVMQQELQKRVLTPKYQNVKAVFALDKDMITLKNEANQTLYATVLCLTELHQAGQINLTPWIEKHIPRQTLDKALTFFQLHTGASLKDAHWDTGIEYEILRFCKVYQIAS